MQWHDHRSSFSATAGLERARHGSRFFSELWSATSKAETEGSTNAPLPVTFVDFSRVVAAIRAGSFDETIIINEVAYLVVEQLLAWLSSLTDADRITFVEGLTASETELVVSCLQTFYLSRSELDRKKTEFAALSLLNSAWATRSAVWAKRNWNDISEIFSKLLDVLVIKRISDKAELAGSVEKLLKVASSEPGGSKIVLERLVQLVQTFSFSGVVVLIDKVDETELTSRSAEATTSVIFPLLSHVQLLEVKDLSWMLFLWSDVNAYLSSGERKVRLDKIPHTTISWEKTFFKQMLDARIDYFSEKRLKFDDLLDNELDKAAVVEGLVSTAVGSPRELIRLLDVIVREHDIRNASNSAITLLNETSLASGQDKYVQECLFVVYEEKMVKQLLRMRDTKFTNKEVQSVFRISPNGARNRIGVWADAGLIRQTGTRAAEGDAGGKPSNEYSVIDARIQRVMHRNLVELEEEAEPEGDPRAIAIQAGS